MDNQQGPNNNNGDKRNDKNGQMLLMLIVVTLVALFIMSLVTRLDVERDLLYGVLKYDQ